MPSFLGGKSRGGFGQPAFFLAGNCMTIVAFKKEVSLKAKASLVKRLYESTDVLYLKKKHPNIYIRKEGEKFKLQKLPSKDFIALFSSRRRACLVLKRNRVSF